jgi:hypothetical protein
MAVQSKMADFRLFFQKFGKNQLIKISPFCKFIFIQKYSYFLEKINVWRKNQNGDQKPRWCQVDYFSNRNSTEMSSSGFVRYIFGCKSVDNKVLFLKNVICAFEVCQNGHKIQNGVRKLHFLNFALKTSIFNRFQKT